MRVLIINGSHRQGNTDILTSLLKKELVISQAEVRELSLKDIQMKLPDGCENCAKSEICENIKDEFSEKIEPKIRDFDIYILVTPTWDDGVTPLTKIFWDRIVSWCHKDRMYLKGKKIAVVTHGMSNQTSWIHVINWVKSICVWEKAKFVGSLTFKSDAQIGSIKIEQDKLRNFIKNLWN